MIVLSNKSGQLGNRLFAFAHFLANAIEHNHVVVNMAFGEYAKGFVNTRDDVFCRYPKQHSVFQGDRLRSFFFLLNKATLKVLRKLNINSSFVHSIFVADLPEYRFDQLRSYNLNSNGFQRAAKSKLVCLTFGRFFRDYTNLEKHQDTVRSFFEPIPKVNLMVEKSIGDLRTKNDIVIGVHIRRGDCVKFANGKYFFSLNVYASRMRDVRRCFSGRKVSFVVCSDEKIEGEIFEGLSTKFGPGHEVGDLYTLAECDYIIGPSSTYSLWASFYGKKPLYQMRNATEQISIENFRILQPDVLFNFSFN